MTAALVLLLANAARADVPPPSEDACHRKALGAACSYDSPQGKIEGTCQNGKHSFFRFSDKKVIETDAIVCKAKDKAPDKSNDKKKSALGADGARGSLALALLACGAGVLMTRRRHARS